MFRGGTGSITSNAKGRAKRRGLVVAAGFLIAISSAIIGGPAAASYSTCDATQNHQAGYATNFYTGTQPMQPEGVSANMSVEFGNLCQTDTNPGVNFSTTWDMVASHDLASYAQSGIMLRYGYTCWQWWAEQSLNGVVSDWYNGGCATQGTTHRVWQQLVPAGGGFRIRSNVDSTIIHESSFDPISTWSYPYYVQFSGETYHDASDIPGYAAAPTAFSCAQIQSFSNNNFYSTCGNAILGGYNYPRYSSSMPACDRIQTWTSG